MWFLLVGEKNNINNFPPTSIKRLNEPFAHSDCSIAFCCAGFRLVGLLSCNLSDNQSSLPHQSSSHCQVLLLSSSPSAIINTSGFFFLWHQCPLSLSWEFSFWEPLACNASTTERCSVCESRMPPQRFMTGLHTASNEPEPKLWQQTAKEELNCHCCANRKTIFKLWCTN